MKIASSAVVAHPIDRVYLCYRDRLPEVVPHLPDISRIEVQSRKATEAGVELLNVWYASTPIPAAARAFVRPNMLRWEDHATWTDATTRCSWRLVVPAFAKMVSCSGSTVIERVDAERTRVTLSGELTLNLARLPGMNRFMAATMGPQVEAFIVRLITPNLEKTNLAIGAFLDAEARS